MCSVAAARRRFNWVAMFGSPLRPYLLMAEMAQPIWSHPDGRPFNQFVRPNHQWCFVTWHTVSYRWSSWLKSASLQYFSVARYYSASCAHCKTCFHPGQYFLDRFSCHDISCNNVSLRLWSLVLFFFLSASLSAWNDHPPITRWQICMDNIFPAHHFHLQAQ